MPRNNNYVRFGSPLTALEIKTLTSVANGLNKKLAAEELGISPATIKGHLHRISIRLGSRNTAHSVRRALETEQIDILSIRPVRTDQ